MNTDLIYQVIAEILDIDIIQLKNSDHSIPLEDFGLTSLKFIKMIVKLEETLSIEIKDIDLLVDNFSTLKIIFNTLEKYTSTNHMSITKKVLITDCDNVLWNGIAGEEKLLLSDINLKYQKLLYELYLAGTLICICSRNEVSYINDAFSTLDMEITQNCIITSRINHINKADNIASISEELNLSLDSFVFVDDSDYELGLVSSLLQDVTVIKAYDYSEEWMEEIRGLFSRQPSLTNRTNQYLMQREREKYKSHFASINDYNASLNTIVVCEPASIDQATRLSELSLRTNQFNLANSRFSTMDIVGFINSKEYKVLVLSAKDKYGDMGIVGCAVVNLNTQTIEAFMLSCRVFERDFEYSLLKKIKEILPYSDIYGLYIPNSKNNKFAPFYSNNGILVVNSTKS